MEDGKTWSDSHKRGKGGQVKVAVVMRKFDRLRVP